MARSKWAQQTQHKLKSSQWIFIQLVTKCSHRCQRQLCQKVFQFFLLFNVKNCKNQPPESTQLAGENIGGLLTIHIVNLAIYYQIVS